jgi:hypothetical protein
MHHILPKGFEHKDKDDSIVIGVILLSTVVYALILVGIIIRNKKSFEKEVEREVYSSLSTKPK